MRHTKKANGVDNKLRKLLVRAARFHARGILVDEEYGVLAIGVVSEAVMDRPISPGEGTPDEVPISAWVALSDQEGGEDLAELGGLGRATHYADRLLGSPRPGTRGLEGRAWTREAQRAFDQVKVKLRPHNALAAIVEHWLQEESQRFPRLFGLLAALLLSATTFLLGLLLG